MCLHLTLKAVYKSRAETSWFNKSETKLVTAVARFPALQAVTVFVNESD